MSRLWCVLSKLVCTVKNWYVFWDMAYRMSSTVSILYVFDCSALNWKALFVEECMTCVSYNTQLTLMPSPPFIKPDTHIERLWSISINIAVSPCATTITSLATFALCYDTPSECCFSLPCVCTLWTLALANIKGQAQSAAIICPCVMKREGSEEGGWEHFGSGV